MRIAAENRTLLQELSESKTFPVRRQPRGQAGLRSISKRIWTFLVVAISGPGLGEEFKTIDETAMPSGFIAPYKSGSRQVRNLWHMPF